MAESDLTPSERVLRARLAAHSSWAKTEDRSARTAPARRAAMERFEKQVDPDGVLDPAERAVRAAHARKAHFTALALKSAKARRGGTRPAPPAPTSDSKSNTKTTEGDPEVGLGDVARRTRRRVIRRPASW